MLLEVRHGMQSLWLHMQHDLKTLTVLPVLEHPPLSEKNLLKKRFTRIEMIVFDLYNILTS